MKLRWGILGVAKINDRLIPGFKQANNAELRAVASRSLEKARTAATAAGIPVAHGNYEALLDDPNIDAVYIPLPNHLHAEWARQAADRGKHILCEKPLTPSAVEARELVDYCRKKNVRLMDGFMWPHHPRTARIRQLLDSGGIGQVRYVAGTFSFPLELDKANIRLNAESAGGSLLDIGCYPVYGIRWAFGVEPVSVFATANFRNNVDLAMSGLLRFVDGGMASFDCSFVLAFRTWLEIVGSEGIVRIPEMWVPPVARATYEVESGGKSEIVTIEGENQIAHMIQDFGRAVFAAREPIPSPDEAVKTVRVLDALAKSARSGREEKV